MPAKDHVTSNQCPSQSSSADRTDMSIISSRLLGDTELISHRHEDASRLGLIRNNKPILTN
jgi:hypothetical protein